MELEYPTMCHVCFRTDSTYEPFCPACDHTRPKATTNLDPKKATGELKPQLQLVPQALLVEVALALKLGQKKHGPWNWRENKVEIMTYLAAAYRHIGQVIEREDVDDRDQESGAHHLGCAAAGLGIVLDALKQGTLVDNRPPSNRKTI